MIRNRLDLNLGQTSLKIISALAVLESHSPFCVFKLTCHQTNWTAVLFGVDVKSVSCGHYELPLYGNELVWGKSFF